MAEIRTFLFLDYESFMKWSEIDPILSRPNQQGAAKITYHANYVNQALRLATDIINRYANKKGNDYLKLNWDNNSLPDSLINEIRRATAIQAQHYLINGTYDEKGNATLSQGSISFNSSGVDEYYLHPAVLKIIQSLDLFDPYIFNKVNIGEKPVDIYHNAKKYRDLIKFLDERYIRAMFALISTDNTIFIRTAANTTNQIDLSVNLESIVRKIKNDPNFLDGLQGEKGDPGPAGPKLKDINVGVINQTRATLTETLTDNTSITSNEFQLPRGLQGERGQSGPTGPRGLPGETGQPGNDATQEQVDIAIARAQKRPFNPNQFTLNDEGQITFIGSGDGGVSQQYVDDQDAKTLTSANEYSDNLPFKTINGQEIKGTGNIEIEGGGGTPIDAYTKAETDTLLDEKQNTLIAGENITIDGNVISASGGGSGGEPSGWQVNGSQTQLASGITRAVANIRGPVGHMPSVADDYGTKGYIDNLLARVLYTKYQEVDVNATSWTFTSYDPLYWYHFYVSLRVNNREIVGWLEVPSGLTTNALIGAVASDTLNESSNNITFDLNTKVIQSNNWTGAALNITKIIIFRKENL